jgi:DNA polymerase
MDSSTSDPNRLRRRMMQRLEDLRQAGVTHVPKRRTPVTGGGRSKGGEAAGPRQATGAPSAVSIPKPPELPPSITRPAEDLFAPEQQARPAAAALSPPERVAALQVLRTEVAGCRRCALLAETRTQTVFGVGDPQARLVFFGEAPGADEDRQGEPFVGRAGQLLTKIIEACRLRREDVYIMNVLKCRPPENRTPLPDEVEHCRAHFERQLDIICPEFICCLGLSASRALLRTEQTMGRLRGKLFDYRGAQVLCTYHPSYLLRNPAAKRDVWEDMKLLMRKMGVELNAQP